jgi:diacylglycerol kinase (ATP)
MDATFIVNRTCGRRTKSQLRGHLSECSPELRYKVIETRYPGDARILARRAAINGADVVVAVGGDGTVNEVLNGIVGTSSALGVIPAGTANDLAAAFRIPTDPGEAVDVIRRGGCVSTDLIKANDRYFLTAGGFGLASEAAAVANRLKSSTGALGVLVRLLGRTVYMLAVLLAYLRYCRRPHILTLHYPGYYTSADVFSLIVANQPFFAKWFRIAPGASNLDGRIDVCLLKRTRRLLEPLIALIDVVSGRHIRRRHVHLAQCERLVITSEEPVAFFGDGEMFPPSKTFHLGVVPRGLKVLTPHGSERLETARQRTYRMPIHASERLTAEPITAALVS